MEGETVKRRMNTISGHFVTGIVSEDIAAAATTHLFPLNCRSNLSSPFTRLDNRLHFGRQASAAQGYFMRQAAIPNEQVIRKACVQMCTIPFIFKKESNLLKFMVIALLTCFFWQENATQQYRVCSGNCINEDKYVAATPPLFSRPATMEPLFARPAPVEFKCSKDGIVEGTKQNEILPSTECPNLARPGGATSVRKQFSSCREHISSPQTQIKGMEWSPRINVIESKSSYVITVELPGVDIGDIRVEMDDNKALRMFDSSHLPTRRNCTG